MRRGPSYRVAQAVLRPPLRALTRHDWRGTEHLPAEGGVVVTPNHVSFIDPLVVADLLDTVGRPPRFLAKDELFRVPGLGPLLRDAGQIPVRRRTADASRAYLDAVAAVRRGECVVVYPEGTLTHDPAMWPMRGHTGAARIALTTGCPVVPLGQWGAQEVMPPRKKRFHAFPRHTVHVLVGAPVDLVEFVGREPTAELLHAATDRIMAAIAALVGELRGESAPRARFDPTTMGGAAPADRPGNTDERQSGPMDSGTEQTP